MFQLLERSELTTGINFQEPVLDHVHKVVETEQRVASALFGDCLGNDRLHLLKLGGGLPFLGEALFPILAHLWGLDGIGRVDNLDHLCYFVVVRKLVAMGVGFQQLHERLRVE